MVLLDPLYPLRNWEEPQDLDPRGPQSRQAAPCHFTPEEAGIFLPRVPFQPSAFFLPVEFFLLLALHVINLSPIRSAALMWPSKAQLLHCPPRALSLTPAWRAGRTLGAEERPPQGRRQSQPETGLDMLEPLLNYLRFSFPSPSSSFHHPFRVVATGGKPTLRSCGATKWWSGVLAKPEWLHTVPSPPPMIHLMLTLKWNQEIFLNINVKLYHLFD